MKIGIFLFAVVLAAVGQEDGFRSPVANEKVPNASLLVVHADVPVYPALAVAARQSGTVRVRVSIRRGVVDGAETDSVAPPVLVHAAKENVRTWQFEQGVTCKVDVTYIYELSKEETGVPENPRIEMDLPSLVRVTGKPVRAVPMDGRTEKKGPA